MIHQAVLQQLLLDKVRQNYGILFQVSKIFRLPFSYNISCSKFWQDRNFQASYQTFFDTRSRANSLYFPTSFLISFPNIRTYILLCSGTDIKEYARTRISLIRKNLSKHQISCKRLCMFSLLHSVHISSGYLDLFYAHCTHHISVHS